MAESVGPGSRVFAMDSDEKVIRSLEKKAAGHGCQNIETHTSSAADPSFIKDRSVDFVLADGLFCTMAPPA